MSPLATRLRVFPRVHIRAFHSPFVALSASNPLVTPSSTAVPIYEKQHDTSPEPHLSSSGTLTYVVSEPDPSHTPYEVPSGAYPNTASYTSYKSTASPSIPHSQITRAAYEASAGGNAAVRSADPLGEIGRGLTNVARSKSGNF